MTIELDDHAFDRGVAAVGTAVARLRSTRERSDSRVCSLVDGDWRGRAADAFLSAWTDWIDAARRVEHALDAMGAQMRTAQQALHATDTAAVQQLASLGSSMGFRIAERLG